MQPPDNHALFCSGLSDFYLGLTHGQEAAQGPQTPAVNLTLLFILLIALVIALPFALRTDQKSDTYK